MVLVITLALGAVITIFQWASATFNQQSLEACVRACGARGVSSTFGSNCSCRDPR